MQRELTGKSALVTGAGRGIGRQVAIAFAREGMRVALLARSRDQIEAVAREIGKTATPIACDISIPEQVQSAVGTAIKALGHIDILVNNAGIFLDATLLETELEDWNRTLAINATGTFLVTKAVLPGMIERRRGRIINVVSSSGLKGYRAQAAYCASKHAMLGMARALALEVKEYNIHVHCLCPGGVQTDFIKGTRLGERLKDQVMIQPEDIADLCVYLCKLPDNLDIEEVAIRRFSP